MNVTTQSSQDSSVKTPSIPNKGFDSNSNVKQVEIPSQHPDWFLPPNPKKTGVGNTPLITSPLLAVHLDYLRIRFECTYDEYLYLLKYIDPDGICIERETKWAAGKNATSYENKVQSSAGLIGGYTELELDKAVVHDDGRIDPRIEAMLDFQGSYFEYTTNEDSWRLLRLLSSKYSANCTRLDIAIDDPTYEQIPIVSMEGAWKNGNKLGFKKFTYICSGDTPDELSETRYFGSRRSPKFVRVYDHKGECLRYEVELKQNYARAVFQLLAAISKDYDLSENGTSPTKISAFKAVETFQETAKKSKYIKEIEIDFKALQNQGTIDSLSTYEGNKGFELSFSQILAGIAVSVIDFRDASALGDKTRVNKRDCPRLEFWQEFMNKTTVSISIKLPVPKHDIQKSIKWINKSWTKLLAVLDRAVGRDDLIELMEGWIDKGVEKLKSPDLAIIALLHEHPEYLTYAFIS